MAGFGIGTNAEKTDAGKLKGERKEIACSCYFSCSGKAFPLSIKVEDEDGEIRIIRQIRVLSQEKKNFCGIPTEEFICEITILGQVIPCKLVHNLVECKWVLVK